MCIRDRTHTHWATAAQSRLSIVCTATLCTKDESGITTVRVSPLNTYSKHTHTNRIITTTTMTTTVTITAKSTYCIYWLNKVVILFMYIKRLWVLFPSVISRGFTTLAGVGPVSYTHLDVYKRQEYIILRLYQFY